MATGASSVRPDLRQRRPGPAPGPGPGPARARSARCGPAAQRRPGSRRWRGAAAAGLAAVLLSACATVPDSGPVQAGKVALTVGGQGQDYLQLIAVPPQSSWSPKQVVSGFLAACASFANNHAIARQYLDPARRKSWKPSWAVTVVRATTVGLVGNIPAHQAGPGYQTARVKVTGERLATLTATGQYVGAQGSSSYKFQLYKIGGQWRIEDPPSRLLLTEPDFKRVYAPRNLYYTAIRARALVPDPVFVPLQATFVDLAYKLVTALRQRPQGWLASGVSTAFPPGTKLRRVTISDGAATVNLGGSAASASSAALSDMTSQLAWTLAGSSGGQVGIQSVDLKINGHLRGSATLSGGQPQRVGRSGLLVPEAAARTPLYSVAANGAVQEQAGPVSAAQSVPGEAGQARMRLATIAVSPGGHDVAGFSRSGKVVYYGPIRRGARLARWPDPSGHVSSLSWDVSGNLWVAGLTGTWMLPSGGGRPVPLGLGLPSGSVVSQLRVAPDGARIAMIVHGPQWKQPQLLLAAIGPVLDGGVALGPTVPIGTDVSDPTKLTWYDANNLIVLSRSPTGPQLQQVPVNGGSPTALVIEPGTQSITAAGPANPMAAGLAGAQLALTTSLNGTWAIQKRPAWSPAYPG